MRIRKATRSDKGQVLSFCSNTFDWGDYIDQVWDLWHADKNGRLLVAESEGSKIAMSHVAVCPGRKSAWLEGVRVHPSYRRSQVASRLIERMVRYGRQKGARQASAIVAADNVASQRMMEKNGFEVVSRWAYYSTTADSAKRQNSEARLATAGDLGKIWQYLQQSRVYRLSAKRYVMSWHWYTLDRKALRNFIKDGRLIVTGKPINGVAIINMHGYWRKKNILQIIYLDPASAKSLRRLVLFVTNLYLDGRFDRLQVLCHESKSMTSFFEKFMIKEEEQFLLYNKVFTPQPIPFKQLDYQYANIAGVSVRYVDTGGIKNAVLLLHGLGGSIESWANNIKEMSKSLRVIAVDLPGFGMSDKPKMSYTIKFYQEFVIQFLKSLQLSRASIVGSSLGGHVAAEVAINHPDVVDRLVLISPPGALPSSFKGTPALKKYVRVLDAKTVQQVKRALFAVDKKPVDDSYAQLVYQKMSMLGAKEAFISALKSSAQAPRLTGRLNRIHASTLLLWGKEDLMIPVKFAESFVKLKNCRIILIEKCGHRPHAERPELFNKTVVDFLAG